MRYTMDCGRVELGWDGVGDKAAVRTALHLDLYIRVFKAGNGSGVKNKMTVT